MSDELVKRLRDDATFWDAGNDIDSSEPLRKAADLIEQQAAKITELSLDLERAREERNRSRIEARREIHKEHRDYIANLEAQIAAVAPAVDAQPVWISVDDRLPDEGQSVAFVVSSASPTFAYLNGRVLGGYFGHVARHPTFSVPGLGLHALHWMPLPTPPHQDPQ